MGEGPEEGAQGAGGRGRTVPHGNAVLCPQAEGNLNIVMEFASRGGAYYHYYVPVEGFFRNFRFVSDLVFFWI